MTKSKEQLDIENEDSADQAWQEYLNEQEED